MESSSVSRGPASGMLLRPCVAALTRFVVMCDVQKKYFLSFRTNIKPKHEKPTASTPRKASLAPAAAAVPKAAAAPSAAAPAAAAAPQLLLQSRPCCGHAPYVLVAALLRKNALGHLSRHATFESLFNSLGLLCKETGSQC